MKQQVEIDIIMWEATLRDQNNYSQSVVTVIHVVLRNLNNQSSWNEIVKFKIIFYLYEMIKFNTYW